MLGGLAALELEHDLRALLERLGGADRERDLLLPVLLGGGGLVARQADVAGELRRRFDDTAQVIDLRFADSLQAAANADAAALVATTGAAAAASARSGDAPRSRGGAPASRRSSALGRRVAGARVVGRRDPAGDRAAEVGGGERVRRRRGAGDRDAAAQPRVGERRRRVDEAAVDAASAASRRSACRPATAG